MYDPDGAQVDQDTSPAGGAGSYTARLTVPKAASRGVYTIVVRAAKGNLERLEEHEIYVKGLP